MAAGHHTNACPPIRFRANVAILQILDFGLLKGQGSKLTGMGTPGARFAASQDVKVSQHPGTSVTRLSWNGTGDISGRGRNSVVRLAFASERKSKREGSMFHISSSIIGGVAAVTAWALVAPSFDSALTAPSANSDSRETATVNRTTKSDRLAPPRPSSDKGTIATVEVVGIRDSAIIYRDRDGRVLFQTDPVSNVTVISKGFVMPEITVRETRRDTPVRIEAPRDTQRERAMPIGCEPLASRSLTRVWRN